MSIRKSKKIERQDDTFSSRGAEVSISRYEGVSATIGFDAYHNKSRKRINSHVYVRMSIENLIKLRDEISHVLDSEIEILNLMLKSRENHVAYDLVRSQSDSQESE